MENVMVSMMPAEVTCLGLPAAPEFSLNTLLTCASKLAEQAFITLRKVVLAGTRGRPLRRSGGGAV